MKIVINLFQKGIGDPVADLEIIGNSLRVGNLKYRVMPGELYALAAAIQSQQRFADMCGHESLLYGYVTQREGQGQEQSL
jgi:hypothetical protein